MPDLEAIARDMTETMSRMSNTGLCHLRGGNCAIRTGEDEFVLTRHATAKDHLTPDCLVVASISSDEPMPEASVNLQLHRLVFRQTDARVILHGHPYSAALLSYWRVASFEPIDENSMSYIGRRIEVVGSQEFKHWAPVEPQLADALTRVPAVVLRWHGGYTIGEDLGAAYHRMQALDFAARFIIDTRRLESSFGPPSLPPYVGRAGRGGNERGSVDVY